MKQDIRYALRSLRKSPGYAVTSIVVLALAIGANTAMFSVLNAVLFRPLPYPAPEQLAMLWSEDPGQGVREGRTAWLTAEQWRRENKSFADMGVFDPVSVTLTSADRAERISAVRMSPSVLRLVRVEPLHGRAFTEHEAGQRQRVALISHRFWRSHFAGSAEALGASIAIDGVPSQVIGILPPLDLPPFDADLFEPHTMFADWETRRGVRGGDTWLVVGRLRQGTTVDQAQAEMTAVARRLNEDLAEVRKRAVSVVPLSRQLTGSKARLALWMLAGAVLCVLLIAATNVASLSLARSASREKEFALRAALGASQWRIVRQMLAESLTLGVISGVLGLPLAVGAVRLILTFKPVNLPRLDEIGLDPQVLGWSLALCLFTGILVGLAPAMTVTRRRSGAVRQDGRRVAGGVAARRIRGALVVGEFAMAIVLLAGAGLLLRSLWSVESVDLGFRPERVLSMQVSTTAIPTTALRTNFYDRVLEQLGALPGVESAAFIGDLFTGGSAEQDLTLDGGTGSGRLRYRRDEISGGFFATVGTPLLRGRFFSAGDGPDSPRVAIVNDAMARRLWPGRDPVGQRFKPGPRDSNAEWFTVVGVVGDMRRHGIENEPIPQMFEPVAQNPSGLAILLVRTSAADPRTMVATVQARVREVDKHVPLYRVTTLEEQVGAALAQRRFQTLVLTGFSLVALLMAAIGIYGLLQHSVVARTQEIGIRVAVGAQSGSIFRMVAGDGLKLSLAGIAIGVVGAVWVGRVASGLLFGVSGSDPWTFVSVSLLLSAVAAAACYFPARRAMKIEPVMALRQE